jgi:hypothetical protein
MRAFFAGFVLLLAALWMAASLGCASSERAAVRKLDLTPDAIQQASALLAADPELGRFPILVDGFKGDMRLKGQVSTPVQKARAEKMLWAVRGVKSVNNEIQVGAAPPARRGTR